MKITKNYPYTGNIAPGTLIRPRIVPGAYEFEKSSYFYDEKCNKIKNMVLHELLEQSPYFLFLGVQKLTDIGKEIFGSDELIWLLHSETVLFCPVNYKNLYEYFYRVVGYDQFSSISTLEKMIKNEQV